MRSAIVHVTAVCGSRVGPASSGCRIRAIVLWALALGNVSFLAGCRDATGPTLSDAARAVSVAAGWRHSCALAADGGAYCWGENGAGQVGDGTMRNDRPTPTAVTGGLRFKSISAGGLETCGITLEGQLYCWGAWAFRAFGEPQNLSGPRLYVMVSSDAHISDLGCALADDGAAYCWGSNQFGEAGDGTTETRRFPVAVATDARFRQLAAGGTFACGLTVSGEVLCWGVGALGDGKQQGHLLPGKVATLERFSWIAAGNLHACALSAAGSAFCWGYNYEGQLADGTDEVYQAAPVPAAAGLKFTQLALGAYHTCGLTRDGTAYCWGRNGNGQLGDGTYERRRAPVLVLGSLRFVSLELGFEHSCGRTRDGSVYCWGLNSHNELGNGSGAPSSPTPVKVTF